MRESSHKKRLWAAFKFGLSPRWEELTSIVERDFSCIFERAYIPTSIRDVCGQIKAMMS